MRTAVFLVPTLAILLLYGGKTTLATVIGGSIICYMLDFLGYQEPTFIAVWVTIAAMAVTLFISSIHLFLVLNSRVTTFNITLIYNMLIASGSLGIWASLQFSFMQRQQPRLVLVFERMLFCITPCSPTVIITWAIIGVNGMSAAPYVLLAVMTAAYFLFVLPVRSSFRMPRKDRPKTITPSMTDLDETVLGRYETAVQTLAYLLLPVMFKIAIHHAHLIASRDDVAGLLTWMLIRVIFHSLNQYIKLAPPWNFIAVTVAVYLFAFIVLAHFAGYLESAGAMILLSIMAVGVAVSGCLALGMPWFAMPVAALGGFFWVRFYYKRQ
ncbi:hypothetical protein GUITHDRAFT_139253 [Guillardia theta CCMP2712]|uniref:Uncharacterized protein n=1 Tax=Guillardia theta (strain CCMP2712) TaxID=905079 RepID=L1J9H0_GUITC|nr:hypothetical protein GUITHDRAFT_139253 [Guillardia theta CCMP2712]EKX44962.1 hypothetical protein GUITHDRAFT_139253 [Guillardia theta CCMP2712]|eukprot:XP_005831942.1 hypothetical protein GUITHDRAFT_139253 [Guillardia theta CCMP2712]